MHSKLVSFFQNRSTAEIARDLLGRVLTYDSPNGLVGGLIVETEAYLGPTDRAAHSYGGHRSPANEGLYCVGGSLYIYSRRQYYFLDISTQEKDNPEGILIRAIQPTIGQEIMLANRIKGGFELTNGPGKFMQAFGVVDKSADLLLLTDSPFTVNLDHKKTPNTIAASPRIGINASDATWANAPLRFYVSGNPFVSRLRKRDYDLANFGWR